MKTEAEKGQENSSKKESVCIDESLGMENASPEMEISRKSTKNQDSSRPLGNGSPASETSEKCKGKRELVEPDVELVCAGCNEIPDNCKCPTKTEDTVDCNGCGGIIKNNVCQECGAKLI